MKERRYPTGLGCLVLSGPLRTSYAEHRRTVQEFIVVKVAEIFENELESRRTAMPNQRYIDNTLSFSHGDVNMDIANSTTVRTTYLHYYYYYHY